MCVVRYRSLRRADHSIRGGRLGQPRLPSHKKISVFPCQHYSINAPDSSSTTCCSYQKDKRSIPANVHTHTHKMLFHKSGNTEREGALSKLTHATLTYADSDRYCISQVPGAANQQSTRMAYRYGCMTGSATFCRFHSDTMRDTAGPVRTGQDRKKICGNEYVSPHLAFSLVPLYVQNLRHVRFVMTSHLEFGGWYCNINMKCSIAGFSRSRTVTVTLTSCSYLYLCLCSRGGGDGERTTHQT